MNQSTLKSHYPVAIVGGGMVGMTLSLGLAKLGIASVVFESFVAQERHHADFDDRTVALSANSLEVFEALAIDGIRELSSPIDSIHVSERGAWGATKINANDEGVQALGGVIENWRLGQLLLKQMAQPQAQKFVDLFSPATVSKLTPFAKTEHNNTAMLTVEFDNESFEVSADLVIVADGAQSPLRKQLHIQSRSVDYEKSAIVCNLGVQLAHNQQAFERFTSDGPMALLPLNSLSSETGNANTPHRMSLVWSKSLEEAQELLEADEATFAQQLEQEFGARLGKITHVGKRQAFPLIQHSADQLNRGRCLLLGNSAQTLHPIAGQGFNLALRDIAALLESVAEPKDELGSYRFLSNFVEQRKHDREQTIATTEGLARLFAQELSPLAFSRSLVLSVLNRFSMAKSYFAQQAMGYKS